MYYWLLPRSSVVFHLAARAHGDAFLEELSAEDDSPRFFNRSLMFVCWLPWGEGWECVSQAWETAALPSVKSL